MLSSLANARWIWAQDYDRPNMFLVARAPHPLPVDPTEELVLEISADSDFALLCLREDGCECLAFGQFPDYAAHKIVEQRRIPASRLAGGRLYLLLTSQNADTSTDRRERAGVIFSLTCADGRPLWRSEQTTELFFTRRHRDADVPLITGQLGFSFDIDLCAPLCGERCVTCLLADMPTQLHPRPIAPLVLGARLPSHLVCCAPFAANDAALPEAAFGVRMAAARPCAAPTVADGVMQIYDLGAEVVGFLALEIDAVRECELLIGWGEHIADGVVRTDVGGRCFAGRCRLAAGHNALLYPLRRLGLRYLQLHLYAPAAEVSVRYAGICPVDYPLPAATPCPLSHGRHGAIYDACVRTLRLCLHDHYEDCPWREQALYTMDSRTQMLCGYYAFGETAAPRASLELMARSLREDGMLELCSPARCGITIPAFSAMFVVQLAEYLAHSGDTATAAALLPTATCITQHMLDRVDAQTGLLPCYPEAHYWNFYEWQTGLEGSISGSIPPEEMTFDAPLGCFVSLALQSLAGICRHLGQAQQAQRLLDRSNALNHALHAAFFDAAAGVYDSFLRLRDGSKFHRCQLTQALALLCGACPAPLADGVRRHLADDDSLLPVTLSHSIFRYDALLVDRGYLDTVLSEIEQTYGAMLDAGATTFWETARGERDFGGAGSLCHGWSAVPLYVDWKYAAATALPCADALDV